MARVLSALVLLPGLIATVWFLPPIGTLVLAEIAAVLAALEYNGLARSLGARLAPIVTTVLVVVACAATALEVVPIELVLMSAMIVVGSFAVGSKAPGPGVLWDTAASLFPIAYIALPLGAIVAVRIIAGREAVLLLIVTIVVSDSAQYYTGRAFGRTPLAPSISPKKTREGAIGGVIFGAAAMTVGGWWLFPDANAAILIVSAVAVVLMGIVGDLFESLLKRSAGIKDSSALIPGHGGILDRIDSWLFSGPVYYMFVRYLQ